MFCEKCGKEVSDNSKFCDGCGAEISASAKAPTPAPEPAPAEEVQSKPEPQPVQQAAPQPQPQPVYTPLGQPQYQQAVYTQPVYAPPQNSNMAPVMTVGQYIGTFILSAIPTVGFILLLIWAFSGGTNPNKKNFARATLILNLICVALTVLIITLSFVAGAAVLNEFMLI